MSPGAGGKYAKLQQMRINRELTVFLSPDKERSSSHCAGSSPSDCTAERYRDFPHCAQ